MGLEIFRDSEVGRGRELVLLFGGSIWVLILAYIVKEIFLTKWAKVGNGWLIEGSSYGLSDKF